MDDIAEREGLAVRRGKMVVELGPVQANKGRAVARLMSEPPYMGAVPIFIGDDVTDEDGFAAAAAAGGYGILVGAPRPTAAHYRLPGTREVRGKSTRLNSSHLCAACMPSSAWTKKKETQ